MAVQWLAHYTTILLLSFVAVYAADQPQDARPVISCFRCIPSQANGYCADDQVEANRADCTAGRCLMMGAKFKQSNDVARLYDCDSANVVDWAFQLFLEQGSDDLPPNTCKNIDFGSASVIDTFRNYGMSSAITALLRGTASGTDLEAQVDQVELCTCQDALCNSVQENQKISLIPRGGRPQPQPQPPGPDPEPIDCGLPWYWTLLIVLWSLLLLLLLASLALYLYKRSKKHAHHSGSRPFDPNRDAYRPGVQRNERTNPKNRN